jgi:Domain of unknown function (DUF892)
MIGKKPQGKTCDAIIGLVEEGQEVMKHYKGSPALDAVARPQESPDELLAMTSLGNKVVKEST